MAGAADSSSRGPASDPGDAGPRRARARHEGREQVRRSRAGRDPFWALLVLLPPLLLLPSLDDALLWQDEAETALLARQVLEHGVPVASDAGRSLSDQQDRSDVSAGGLWIWSPWLPHYTAAASFALLGESAFSARLPFVLAAWATLLAAYPLFGRLAGAPTARLAVMLLALSVPFLLLARQCRYYALAALLSTLFLAAYRARRPRVSLAAMALAGTGLAYTFPPQLVVVGIACAVHAAVVRRDGALFARLAGAGALAAAAFAPFWFFARMWDRSYRDAGHAIDSWVRAAVTLRAYALEIHLYAWPFLLALPLAWRAAAVLPAARRDALRTALVAGGAAWLLAAIAPASGPALAAFLALSVVGMLAALGSLVGRARRTGGSGDADGWALVGLVLAVGTPLLALPAPFPFFRYLAGQLPLFALATAGTLRGLAPGRPWLAWGLAAALVASDALAVGPFVAARLVGSRVGLGSEAVEAAFQRLPGWAMPAERLTREMLREIPRDAAVLRLPALDYARELAGEYRGPVRAVVCHLRREAHPGELILTSRARYPLLFYTPLSVWPFEQAAALGEPPEWVWQGPRAPRLPAELRQALSRDYRPVRLAARELPWENIPEPMWHRFRLPPPTGGADAVVTLHRRRSTGARKPAAEPREGTAREVPLSPPCSPARPD